MINIYQSLTTYDSQSFVLLLLSPTASPRPSSTKILSFYLSTPQSQDQLPTERPPPPSPPPLGQQQPHGTLLANLPPSPQPPSDQPPPLPLRPPPQVQLLRQWPLRLPRPRAAAPLLHPKLLPLLALRRRSTGNVEGLAGPEPQSVWLGRLVRLCRHLIIIRFVNFYVDVLISMLLILVAMFSACEWRAGGRVGCMRSDSDAPLSRGPAYLYLLPLYLCLLSVSNTTRPMKTHSHARFEIVYNACIDCETKHAMGPLPHLTRGLRFRVICLDTSSTCLIRTPHVGDPKTDFGRKCVHTSLLHVIFGVLRFTSCSWSVP